MGAPGPPGAYPEVQDDEACSSAAPLISRASGLVHWPLAVFCHQSMVTFRALGKTMDAVTRSEIKELREVGSEAAATRLLSKYPRDSDGWGRAIEIIAHLSWKPADQVRLAEEYIQKLPFASGRAYDVFASMMPLARFMEIVERNMPTDPARIDLALYYLLPALRRHSKAQHDVDLVAAFTGRWAKRA